MFPSRIGQGARVLGVAVLTSGLIYAHSFTPEGEHHTFDLVPGLDHTESPLYTPPPRITSDMFASSTSATTWDSSDFGLLDIQPRG